MKTCSKCGECKPATLEYFYKDKSRKGGLTPQCKACIQAYQHERQGRQQEREVSRAWRKVVRSSPAYRASRLIAEAKKRKPEGFSLTLDLIRDKIETGFCEVTGLPFDLSGRGSPPLPLAPSLDKIDPSGEYTPENTQVVVWIYNRAKGPGNHEDVLNMATALIAANDNK